MFSNNQPSATGTQQILYGLHLGLDLSQTILKHVCKNAFCEEEKVEDRTTLIYQL